MNLINPVMKIMHISQNQVSESKALGMIYQKGDEDIERDILKAVSYFGKAEKNNSFASYSLGLIYQKGDEKVKKDIQRAVMYFSKSGIFLMFF